MKLKCTFANIAIILSASSVVLVLACATATTGGKITLQELLTYKTIRVGDLKKLNLDVKEGHGSFLWAAIDDNKEVWFWCRPGISAVLGTGKIILIAIIDSNDENRGTIIWPKDKVNNDYGKELKLLYKNKK